MKEKINAINSSWLDINQFKLEYEKKKVLEFPNKTQKIKPIISVVLITYQHKELIAHAIESVIMQKTEYPFELIIGDDESTDGTREICLDYARKYPDLIKLLLHNNENKISILDVKSGIFQIAYNILSARGEFLILTSGDDYWTDEKKLQKQAEYLLNNPNVSCCYHAHKKKIDGQIQERLLENIMPLTAMMRNCFIKLPRQFVEIINEDVFLYSICDLFGDRKYLENISPSIYNQHGENLWRKQVINNKNLALFVTLHWKLFEAMPTFWLKNRFVHKYIWLAAKYAIKEPKTAEKEFIGPIKEYGPILFIYFLIWKVVLKLFGFK